VHHFRTISGVLHAESVPLGDVARAVGTPTFVYSRATLARHVGVFSQAFGSHPHLICYSVKANGNLSILALLSRLGAGMDIVSGGELHRCRLAGVPADRIVFSGVGKEAHEVREALAAGIKVFNVESEDELRVLETEAAAAGSCAPLAVRVNPEVDAQTHPYIATALAESKFGVSADEARRLYAIAQASPHLEAVGIDCHIGSQISTLDPLVEAFDRMATLVDDVRRSGVPIRVLDIGGGLGISYREGTPPPPHPSEYASAVLDVLGRRGLSDLEIVIEPGRVIVGNAGILLTRVIRVKETAHRRFVVVDAAMNDLVRPSLYGSWHEVQPVEPRPGVPTPADVVGPVCESADFLAKERPLAPLQPGDLVAVFSAGAYGFAMSSNYNARPRAAEVLVDGDRFEVIRTRETRDDLVRGETEAMQRLSR
jgi:diaminopimelate decarboxylase